MDRGVVIQRHRCRRHDAAQVVARPRPRTFATGPGRRRTTPSPQNSALFVSTGRKKYHRARRTSDRSRQARQPTQHAHFYSVQGKRRHGLRLKAFSGRSRQILPPTPYVSGIRQIAYQGMGTQDRLIQSRPSSERGACAQVSLARIDFISSGVSPEPRRPAPLQSWRCREQQLRQRSVCPDPVRVSRRA